MQRASDVQNGSAQAEENRVSLGLVVEVSVECWSLVANGERVGRKLLACCREADR